MADHGFFEELICAGLDGELTAEQQAALDAHLAECEQCRAFRDALEAVEGVSTRHLPDPPAELTANVMAAVRAQAKQKKKGKILAFPGRSLAVAAAAALVLWAGVRATNLFRPKGMASAAPMAAMTDGAEIAYDRAEAEEFEISESAAEEYADVAEAPAEAAGGLMSSNAIYTGPASDKGLTEELLCQISDRNGPLRTLPVSELPEGLLLPAKPCTEPDREPDYILLISVPEGDAKEYWFWEQDGTMIVETNTGDVTVFSASQLGTVSVETDTGEVDMIEVQCAELLIRTKTGEVELEGVTASGKTELETDTGDIELKACDAGTIYITTDTGDIEGTLLSPKLFEASSDTGRVNVPSPMPGGRCVIKSDTGDIRIEVLN